MNLSFLENKNIIILGLGREGESTFKFLRSIFPQKKLGLADQYPLAKLSKSLKIILEKDKNINLFLGDNYLKSLNDSEIIFKTPGLPEKILKPYLRKNHNILSQIELFLNEHHLKSIGVTGTKGKSTTASLIYHIFKNAELKAKLIGNIGKPVLRFSKDKDSQSVFVIELSSHQLNHTEISPHIAVFLNIFREHLDYYDSFQEYFQAKKNITKWQNANDYFVFNSDFAELKQLAKQTKAKLISFGLRNKKGIHLKDGAIFTGSKRIISLEEIPLKGKHNILNVMAAIAVASIFKIKPENIKEGIKHFKPLEHRIELFANYKGIDFYNDSIATIPEATIQAINSIPSLETLIAGGLDRGQDFKSLGLAIKRRHIKNLILLPDTGNKIAQSIVGKKIKIVFVNNMKEAARQAFLLTHNGACLLSPASASFNLFKDYKDRGKKFKQFINSFIKNG